MIQILVVGDEDCSRWSIMPKSLIFQLTNLQYRIKNKKQSQNRLVLELNRYELINKLIMTTLYIFIYNINISLIYFSFYYYMIYEKPNRGKVLSYSFCNPQYYQNL